jgi:ketosteroid isomerase-like protein
MRHRFTIVFLFGVLTLLAACSKTPSEKALRDTIAAMQAAVEKKDASAFMQHVSENVRVTSPDTGELDRQGMRRTLSGILLAYPNINTGATIRELTINGSNAQTTVEVLSGGGAGALPDAVRHFSFNLSWAHDGSMWKLTRATWER